MFNTRVVPPSLTPALLQVRGLEGGYGDGSVLHGVNFDVHAGEVVSLLGRNGAGKSTIMRALMGILAHSKGSARFGGVETIGLPSRKIAGLGI